MKHRALGFIAALCVAAVAAAANGPPLASVWNIAPTGSAASSGDLVFRVTPGDGSDPIEITVPVIMGAKQETVARSIRNSLNSQLPQRNFNVELGAGTNVLVSDPRGQPNFSLELLDSDVENLRVAVASVTPAAAPTAPPQTVPPVPPSVTPPANSSGATVPPPASVPSPGTTSPVPNQNPPQPGAPTPVPNQNLPPPGAPTPVPNPSAPTPSQSPQSPTPAPGNTASPPAQSPAPSGASAAAPPGQ